MHLIGYLIWQFAQVTELPVHEKIITGISKTEITDFSTIDTAGRPRYDRKMARASINIGGRYALFKLCS